MKRQIDVGFGVQVSPLPDEVRAQPLLDSGWALLMRAGHRLAGLKSLQLEDLASERIIVPARAVNAPLYDSVVAHCRASGFTPNFVYETMQAQVGITLVEQGLGVMLGAAYVFSSLPPGLVYRPIEGLDSLTVQMFTRADESATLVLDLIFVAAEEARRAQLRSGYSLPHA
jgi:DNA-binding transcriptional LysR family regulator